MKFLNIADEFTYEAWRGEGVRMINAEAIAAVLAPDLTAPGLRVRCRRGY